MINFKLIAEYLDVWLEEWNSDFLFEMANLGSKTTGLPMVVWISSKMSKHGPRIKVQQKRGNKPQVGNWASITIEDSPRLVKGKLSNEDFELAKRFIILNKENLIKYWKNEILTDDLILELKKV